MFTHQKTTLALLLFFLCYCVTLGQTLPTIATIPQQEYASRRSRLVALLDTTEAIAMKAANFRVRSNDVSYRYRQESNFLYATGLNSPGHYLLAAPKGIIVDGKSYRVVLFVAKGTDDSKEVFAGENELILDAERFGDVFKSVLAGTKTLYASTLDLEMVFDWLNDQPLFVDRDARKNLERDHPELKVKNPSGFFAKLRVVKSNNEIGLIQEAIELTAKGIQKALVTCKSDGYEYELQAAIEGEMIGGGASYTGFPSIIGSGENSLVLHYDKNRRRMKSGELVVMDVGAEYRRIFRRHHSDNPRLGKVLFCAERGLWRSSSRNEGGRTPHQARCDLCANGKESSRSHQRCRVQELHPPRRLPFCWTRCTRHRWNERHPETGNGCHRRTGHLHSA